MALKPVEGLKLTELETILIGDFEEDLDKVLSYRFATISPHNIERSQGGLSAQSGIFFKAVHQYHPALQTLSRARDKIKDDYRAEGYDLNWDTPEEGLVTVFWHPPNPEVSEKS